MLEQHQRKAHSYCRIGADNCPIFSLTNCSIAEAYFFGRNSSLKSQSYKNSLSTTVETHFEGSETTEMYWLNRDSLFRCFSKLEAFPIRKITRCLTQICSRTHNLWVTSIRMANFRFSKSIFKLLQTVSNGLSLFSCWGALMRLLSLCKEVLLWRIDEDSVSASLWCPLWQLILRASATIIIVNNYWHAGESASVTT